MEDTVETVEVLKEELRDHGLHVTTARLAVLQALHADPGHQSAEEIRVAVVARYPAVNQVTIYRTLEMFEAQGVAARVTLGDKLTRWERIAPIHHHVLCRACGAVQDVEHAPFERLAADLERTYGVRVEVRHLALPGLCAQCAASAV